MSMCLCMYTLVSDDKGPLLDELSVPLHWWHTGQCPIFIIFVFNNSHEGQYGDSQLVTI